MAIKVGVPSTLFYYNYFPMVQTFFQELGVEVVTSKKTSKNIINAGIQKAHADTCVSIKVFYGHVQDLKDKVDFLFIPKVFCLNGKTVYCPKFLALSDMMKHSLDGLPEIIDTHIDVRENRFAIWQAFYEIGQRFTSNKIKIFSAYYRARRSLKKYRQLMLQGLTPEQAMLQIKTEKKQAVSTPKAKSLRFAVLGYSYVVHDDFVSVNMLDKLSKLGVQTITLEQIPAHWIKNQSKKLPKNMFWTFSDQLIKAAFHFFEHQDVDGLIYVSTFACGPDSMVIDQLKLEAQKRPEVPFMCITLDEHSGDAGMHTRLEAFTDMVRRKKESGGLKCAK